MSTAWQVVMDSMNTATETIRYAGDRLYPGRLPQRPGLPAITYQDIDIIREHAMHADPGDAMARVQVDIYDRTYLGTASGSARVRAVLSRTRGLTTTGGGKVYDVFADAERTTFVPQLEGVEAGPVWRRSLDFLVHYTE